MKEKPKEEEEDQPGFLTVVLTAYPFSSNSLTNKDATNPVPPTTQAVFVPTIWLAMLLCLNLCFLY